MSQTIQLTCDNCGVIVLTPAYGWLSLKPAPKSKVISEPEAVGDFCGKNCLTEFPRHMMIQVPLDMFASEDSPRSRVAHIDDRTADLAADMLQEMDD